MLWACTSFIRSKLLLCHVPSYYHQINFLYGIRIGLNCSCSRLRLGTFHLAENDKKACRTTEGGKSSQNTQTCIYDKCSSQTWNKVLKT